jgi:2-aminoadipate transaminase
MVAPAPLAAKFETAKQTLDLCTGGLDQRVVYEACRRGVLDRQIPLLRQAYRHKRDVMERALRSTLAAVASWRPPRGGFFLWVTLPNAIDAGHLLRRAVAHKVIYVAGQAFFVDGSGANTLRLSFSFVNDERIVEGVQRLAAAVNEEIPAALPTPARG